MKPLFLLLAVLLAVVSVALLVAEDPGYVLVAVRGWTLETTVSVLVVGVLGLALALHWALRLLAGVGALPHRMGRWQAARRLRAAGRALTQGLLALAEGRWAAAEQTLVKHAADSPAPALNYLAAARAAHAQGAYERRDRYLRLAHECLRSARLAVGLTQAELQLDQGQKEQALATLRHLFGIAPKNRRLLRALARVYADLGEWAALAALLPRLRRLKVLEESRLQDLERRTYLAQLQEAPDAARLQSLWHGLPKALRWDPVLVAAYVRGLQAAGSAAEAERVLRRALARAWDQELVRLYGQVEGPDPAAQLTAAEAFLREHEADPVLLLTLGRLCRRQGLWGKARAYLEASLGHGPLPETYWELGGLLEATGAPPREALRCYREGLRLALGEAPPAALVPAAAAGA